MHWCRAAIPVIPFEPSADILFIIYNLITLIFLSNANKINNNNTANGHVAVVTKKKKKC